MRDGYDDYRRHVLKTISSYYHQVKKRIKTFELRQYSEQGAGKPARDFRVGDLLELRDNASPAYYLLRKVTYVLKDTDEGMQDSLPQGFCILGIEPLPYGQPEYNDCESRGFEKNEMCCCLECVSYKGGAD